MELKEIIYGTIDEFNNSQKDHKIEKNPSFLIAGDGSSLDSLACINFLSRLEKNIKKNFNKEIDIINKIFSENITKFSILDLENILKD